MKNECLTTVLYINFNRVQRILKKFNYFYKLCTADHRKPCTSLMGQLDTYAVFDVFGQIFSDL